MPQILRDVVVKLLTKHPRSEDFTEGSDLVMSERSQDLARVYDVALADLLAGLEPVLDAVYYDAPGARAVVPVTTYLAAQSALREALLLAGYAPGRTSPLLDAALAVVLGDAPIVPLKVWTGRLLMPDMLMIGGGRARMVVEVDGVDAVDFGRRDAAVVLGVIRQPEPTSGGEGGETNGTDQT